MWRIINFNHQNRTIVRVVNAQKVGKQRQAGFLLMNIHPKRPQQQPAVLITIQGDKLHRYLQ
jgi:hypothetical protein